MNASVPVLQIIKYVSYESLICREQVTEQGRGLEEGTSCALESRKFMIQQMSLRF